MAYALDPQLLQEITAALASGAMTLPQPAARDDWKTLRASSEAALAALEAALPQHPNVSRSAYTATSHDGARWRCAGTPRQVMTHPKLAERRSTCMAAG